MKQKKLSIKIITLFPEFVTAFADAFGILKKAALNKLLQITPVDLRTFGLGQRQVVDDRPYGGGVGMVLRADILWKAIKAAKSSKFEIRNSKQIQKSKNLKSKTRVILLTPQGKRFHQSDAKRLAKYDELIFVCGRYEGFDERVRLFVDEEISIGDYILMGGELPALVVSEAVMRLRPGILGKIESTEYESFSESMLEYPQYTKPEVLQIRAKGKGLRAKHVKVPKVLLAGHHQNIQNWRTVEAIKRTKKRRPDLLAKSSK